MATYYPKTSLSLRTTDQNDNNKTFSIGYVNPESDDGTLKTLAQKIVDLSELTLYSIYKSTQDDITDASTDTGDAPITINSTTDYFSNDSATFQAAVSSLTGTVTLEPTANNITYHIFVDLGKARLYSSWSEYAKYISSLVIGVINNKFTQLAEVEGKPDQMIFHNFGAHITQLKLSQDTSNSQFVTGIWTNIIQPPESAPYTINSRTEGASTVIDIVRT